MYCLSHWGPNAKLFLQRDISFWWNIQIFWTKLLHLSVFLAKQYTSLIYAKKKSFCLVNWAFPLVSPRGPILCRKVAKIFHSYEGWYIIFSFFLFCTPRHPWFSVPGDCDLVYCVILINIYIQKNWRKADWFPR